MKLSTSLLFSFISLYESSLAYSWSTHCSFSSGGPGSGAVNAAKEVLFSKVVKGGITFPGADSSQPDGQMKCGSCQGASVTIGDHEGYSMTYTQSLINSALSGQDFSKEGCCVTNTQSGQPPYEVCYWKRDYVDPECQTLCS